jgi:hypothetical protein
MLISASAALGAYYGFTVGNASHLALGIILGGAALGGELLKPLAVVGTVDSFRLREFGRAISCATLALVCVTYSLAAELSLAAGSRGDLASTRQDAANAFKSAEGRRARAEAELQTLPLARPVAELEPLIAKLKATPGANGCKVEPDGPVSRLTCGEVLTLQAEAARAQRRVELEASIARLSAEIRPGQHAVGHADPLASSLSAYLAATGRTVLPDTIAPWLALIPVLFLEIGSSLALVVVRSLGASPNQTAPREAFAAPVPSPVEAVPPVAAPEASVDPIPTLPAQAAPEPDTLSGPVMDARPDMDPPEPPKPARKARRTRDDGHPAPRGGQRLGANVVDLLKARGGKLEGGQRGIAKALGISKSYANELLAELAASGRVKLTTGRTGTRVELPAAAA